MVNDKEKSYCSRESYWIKKRKSLAPFFSLLDGFTERWGGKRGEGGEGSGTRKPHDRFTRGGESKLIFILNLFLSLTCEPPRT